MVKTVKLTISTDNDKNIIKIGSELNLDQHEITIDKSIKTIEGVKIFFEKLILHSFQENIKFILEIKEDIKEEINENIDSRILDMIEQFVKQFNETNIGD